MNNKLPLDELCGQLAGWVRKNAKTPQEQSRLARKVFDGLADELLRDAPGQCRLQAPNAVVEVVADDGRLYRRYLELGYDESENGLRLLGEDMGGAPVQITYLSETALGRMHELQGKGPDAPRCDDH